jgi:Ras-related protein Rab-18
MAGSQPLKEHSEIISDAEADVVLKILLIGDSGVGKSSLLCRFIDDTFDTEANATIGVDFKTKVLRSNGKTIKLSLWDTAGQERFRTLTSAYYRGAHGVVCVYDVARHETFLHMDTWLQELKLYSTSAEVVKMLVGNKIDLAEREVQRADGEQAARSHAMLFIESSAKTSEGVADAFGELVQKILDSTNVLQDVDTSVIRLQEQPDAEYYSYCGGSCAL